MKKALKIPQFKNEDQERQFWSKIDLSDYLQPVDFKPVMFPNLKPSSQPVSIRLPKQMIYQLKEKANQLNIPYQSLIKQYINQGLGC